MTSSLVGSEMCIRDSSSITKRACLSSRITSMNLPCSSVLATIFRLRTVSYTHLTLPTICSV
eukprot:2828403-Prorocentrum_lima.AAC.1